MKHKTLSLYVPCLEGGYEDAGRVDLAGYTLISDERLYDLEEAEHDALEQARLNGMGAERELVLLAKLEAAEKERDELLAGLDEWLNKTKWVQQGVNEGMISAKYLGLHRADVMTSLLGEAEKERDALRAKIEQMERQAPVAKVRVHQIEAGGYRDIGTDLTDDALAAIHMLGIIGTYGKKGAAEMRGLFCDCKTDEEKSAFFLSGRAVETGVIAAAISNDVAMAYHRCSEFKKENIALLAKIAEMEQQEPVGKFIRRPSNGLWEQDGYGDNPDARPLYALPGAQTQGDEK